MSEVSVEFSLLMLLLLTVVPVVTPDKAHSSAGSKALLDSCVVTDIKTVLCFC